MSSEDVRALIAAQARSMAEGKRPDDSVEVHASWLNGVAHALEASAVSNENGSCWDEGPTLPVREGECAPMPPLCELKAGHLGAHRGPRNMHGLATEWMTRGPANPPTITDDMVKRAVDVMLHGRGLAGRSWPEYAREVLAAALHPGGET